MSPGWFLGYAGTADRFLPQGLGITMRAPLTDSSPKGSASQQAGPSSVDSHKLWATHRHKLGTSSQLGDWFRGCQKVSRTADRFLAERLGITVGRSSPPSSARHAGIAAFRLLKVWLTRVELPTANIRFRSKWTISDSEEEFRVTAVPPGH